MRLPAGDGVAHMAVHNGGTRLGVVNNEAKESNLEIALCTVAAPALASSMADSATCSGVTGVLGCLPTVSPVPVTAQVMITSLFMRCVLAGQLLRKKDSTDFERAMQIGGRNMA